MRSKTCRFQWIFKNRNTELLHLFSIITPWFYIGASITEIINWSSLITIFLVMFLTWLTRFFTICYDTAITHDIRGRREKLKENWRQGLSSVISVEVAGIPYWTEIKFYEIKSKISPSHLMLWSVDRKMNIYIFALPKELPNKMKLARLFC